MNEDRPNLQEEGLSTASKETPNTPPESTQEVFDYGLDAQIAAAEQIKTKKHLSLPTLSLGSRFGGSKKPLLIIVGLLFLLGAGLLLMMLVTGRTSFGRPKANEVSYEEYLENHCEYCGEELAGGGFCEDCLKHGVYATCDFCQKNKKVYSHLEKLACDSCRDSYNICDNCNKTEECYPYEDLHYCIGCYDLLINGFGECRTCGQSAYVTLYCGDYYCANCHPENVCSNCGTLSGNLIFENELKLCPDCHALYGYCEYCSEYKLIDRLRYCSDCIANFQLCFICGTIEPDIRLIDSHPYCLSCFHSVCMGCERCQTVEADSYYSIQAQHLCAPCHDYLKYGTGYCVMCGEKSEVFELSEKSGIFHCASCRP